METNFNHTPCFHDVNLNLQTDAEMLVVQPTEESWKHIATIQNTVGDILKQEGLTTWTPASMEKAHFTLYAGLNGLSNIERAKLMQRVAEKVSQIPEFNLQVKMNEKFQDHAEMVSTTHVKRGPYKWLTLIMAKDQLKDLTNKIKEAVREAIEHNELDAEHADLDKLTKHHATHITLGVLDVDDHIYKDLPPNHSGQHPEILQLNNQEAKKAFGKLMANEHKGKSFTIPVREISLIGIQNLQGPLTEKHYHLLAHCPMGSSYAPKSSIPSKKSILKPMAIPQEAFKSANQLHDESILKDKLISLLPEEARMMASHKYFNIKPSKDEKGKSTIEVHFSAGYGEETIYEKLATVRPSNAKNGWYYIRLGEERCQKLFGVKQGKSIYNSHAA